MKFNLIIYIKNCFLQVADINKLFIFEHLILRLKKCANSKTHVVLLLIVFPSVENKQVFNLFLKIGISIKMSSHRARCVEVYLT